jgi:hypothetical protein
MADTANKRRLTDEEIEELTKDVADDPETPEQEEPQKFDNPMYDRWAADEESINKYGL